jgi:hypothetical protein
MWGTGWDGWVNYFEKAELTLIKTGALLQFYEINPTVSKFALRNDVLWLVERLGGLV